MCQLILVFQTSVMVLTSSVDRGLQLILIREPRLSGSSLVGSTVMISFIFEKPFATTASDCRISTYKRSNFGIFGNADFTTLSSNKSNAVTCAKILFFFSTISLLMTLISHVDLYFCAFAHINFTLRLFSCNSNSPLTLFLGVAT